MLTWRGQKNGTGSLQGRLAGAQQVHGQDVPRPENRAQTQASGCGAGKLVNPRCPLRRGGAAPGCGAAAGTHFPLAECLAVILSSSFLPDLRSCLPSMEPVCTAFSGSQKVICEFRVATASSAPSGRKVTARAEERCGSGPRKTLGCGRQAPWRCPRPASIQAQWHPEGPARVCVCVGGGHRQNNNRLAGGRAGSREQHRHRQPRAAGSLLGPTSAAATGKRRRGQEVRLRPGHAPAVGSGTRPPPARPSGCSPSEVRASVSVVLQLSAMSHRRTVLSQEALASTDFVGLKQRPLMGPSWPESTCRGQRRAEDARPSGRPGPDVPATGWWAAGPGPWRGHQRVLVRAAERAAREAPS